MNRQRVCHQKSHRFSSFKFWGFGERVPKTCMINQLNRVFRSYVIKENLKGVQANVRFLPTKRTPDPPQAI